MKSKLYYHIPVRNPETLFCDGYWKIGEEMYNEILRVGKEQFENFDNKKLFVTRDSDKIIIHTDGK